MKKNTDEDAQLFRAAISGVKPFHAEKKVRLNKKKTDESVSYRRHRATSANTPLLPSINLDKKVDAHTVMAYAQTGLSTKQYQQLKTGQLKVEAYLDLHGYRQEAALLALQQFMNQAREQGLRCLRIVHGKGSDKPLLKNLVLGFLEQESEVLAYHSAPPEQGGTGAVLVLLKR